MGNEIFIFLSLLLFGLVSLWKKELGVYLIILLLPAYQIRFQVFGIPATFLEGMILVLTVIVIANEVKQSHGIKGLFRRFTPRNDIAIFILLFLLAATISIFASPVPVKGAGIWKAFFVEPIIFFFLIGQVIDSGKKLKNLFLAGSGLVLYLSMFGIYQFFSLESLPFSWWAVNVESRRIISLVNHPNGLALLLGPLLALLIFLPRKTKLHWAGIILGAITLYLSFSRAAWLAVIATVLIFKFVVAPFMEPDPEAGQARYGAGKSGSYKKVASIVFIIILILLIIPSSRQKLLELTNQGDASRQNRIVLWSAAADIIKKHPLLGVGLMGFREAYKNYPLGPDRVVQNYPHNFFLNFWVETGLLGLISISALLILFYKKRPPLPAAAAMTVILLHGLVDVPYFKNDLSVLFWTIYALSVLSKPCAPAPLRWIQKPHPEE